MSLDSIRTVSSCPEAQSALQTIEPRYTKVPDQIARLDLTPREEQLVHRLLMHRWTAAAEMFPSINRLAELMHCCRRTVQRTARKLEGRGLLVIDPRRFPVTGQTTNMYRLDGALLAMVTQVCDQVVARPVDDRRPPMTSMAPKRNPGNLKNTTRDEKPGAPPIKTAIDPSKYTDGPLSRRFVNH